MNDSAENFRDWAIQIGDKFPEVGLRESEEAKFLENYRILWVKRSAFRVMLLSRLADADPALPQHLICKIPGMSTQIVDNRNEVANFLSHERYKSILSTNDGFLQTPLGACPATKLSWHDFIEGLDADKFDYYSFSPEEHIKFLQWFVKVGLNCVLSLENLNLLHRDIKPRNIVVGADGKLYFIDTDLLISREDADEVPKAGSQHFTPPDIHANGSAKTHDVYGLGMTVGMLSVGSGDHDRAYIIEVLKSQEVNHAWDSTCDFDGAVSLASFRQFFEASTAPSYVDRPTASQARDILEGHSSFPVKPSMLGFARTILALFKGL